MKRDDVFSIEIGLECARIVGPVRCLWISSFSVEIRNKGSAEVRPLSL